MWKGGGHVISDASWPTGQHAFMHCRMRPLPSQCSAAPRCTGAWRWRAGARGRATAGPHTRSRRGWAQRRCCTQQLRRDPPSSRPCLARAARGTRRETRCRCAGSCRGRAEGWGCAVIQRRVLTVQQQVGTACRAARLAWRPAGTHALPCPAHTCGGAPPGPGPPHERPAGAPAPLAAAGVGVQGEVGGQGAARVQQGRGGTQACWQAQRAPWPGPTCSALVCLPCSP